MNSPIKNYLVYCYPNGDGARYFVTSTRIMALALEIANGMACFTGLMHSIESETI